VRPQPGREHSRCVRVDGIGWRRGRDSNPWYPSGYNGFQDRRLKPLGHLSARGAVQASHITAALALLRNGTSWAWRASMCDAAGAACLAGAAMRLRVDNVPLLLMLLAIAVVTSAGKIELPLGRSQSNLSLSHAVNFWALFAVGPTAAIGIAAVSAWAQCTLR